MPRMSLSYQFICSSSCAGGKNVENRSWEGALSLGAQALLVQNSHDANMVTLIQGRGECLCSWLDVENNFIHWSRCLLFAMVFIVNIWATTVRLSDTVLGYFLVFFLPYLIFFIIICFISLFLKNLSKSKIGFCDPLLIFSDTLVISYSPFLDEEDALFL